MGNDPSKCPDFEAYMDRHHPGWNLPYGPSSFGITDMRRIWTTQGIRMYEKLAPERVAEVSGRIYDGRTEEAL